MGRTFLQQIFFRIHRKHIPIVFSILLLPICGLLNVCDSCMQINE